MVIVHVKFYDLFRTIISALLLLILNLYQNLEAQKYLQTGSLDGNLTQYTNPVLHADYSDPDVIRVGLDYYMISSSLHHVPGLPVLHSKNLVDWTLIGHVLPRLIPEERYQYVHHGSGVWAPSIRYHDSTFVIYYPDPDVGIFVTKSKNILGPWSAPILVEAGKGLIDPCPLWDDDGRLYLVHAFAGSRASLKSIIVVKELNPEGTCVISPSVLIYDGHDLDPTVEGPKFYKKNGFYYIFAPAGGVSTGWQIVLRSQNIYGPYERKMVMSQGSTKINGPHQGAWVEGHDEKDWFVHFQDKEAFGRIVHLQPMVWKNGWPVIGEDFEGDDVGQPVMAHPVPGGLRYTQDLFSLMSDEFDKPVFSPQWQWQANPHPTWAMPSVLGYLRLYPTLHDSLDNQIWMLPNLLGQKFPSPSFTATIKVDLHFNMDGERFGFGVFGLDLAYLECKKMEGKTVLSYRVQKNVETNPSFRTELSFPLSVKTIYFRVSVLVGGMCQFYYSTDGNNFSPAGSSFTAKPGKWVGAKIGMFTTRSKVTNDMGWVDVDWFRYQKSNP